MSRTAAHQSGSVTLRPFPRAPTHWNCLPGRLLFIVSFCCPDREQSHLQDADIQHPHCRTVQANLWSTMHALLTWLPAARFSIWPFGEYALPLGSVYHAGRPGTVALACSLQGLVLCRLSDPLEEGQQTCRASAGVAVSQALLGRSGRGVREEI